jgi:two-component sensor histidine kinase
VTLEGPDVLLPPEPAMTLGLVLHELGTNAAKYGALSGAAGTVHLAWTRGRDSAGDTLDLIWRETGGPKVAPPRRSGFGTSLLDFSASYSIAYDEGGIVCSLTLSMPSQRRDISVN